MRRCNFGCLKGSKNQESRKHLHRLFMTQRNYNILKYYSALKQNLHRNIFCNCYNAEWCYFNINYKLCSSNSYYNHVNHAFSTKHCMTSAISYLSPCTHLTLWRTFENIHVIFFKTQHFNKIWIKKQKSTVSFNFHPFQIPLDDNYGQR